MLRITPRIAIDESEITESFIHASGPGGQNVNKVSTAVELRFHLRNSPSLPEAVKLRAATLAGRKLTKDGVLVITAQRFRSQEMNRQDALDRLVALLTEATVVPVFRRPTKPTKASKTRRLDAKTKRGDTKRNRQTRDID